MKMGALVWKTLLVGSLVFGAVGCGDDGDDSSPPVGPSVAGNWTGVYYEEDGGRVPISASVGQDGAAVTIRTSKPTPPGQSLSGTITEDGDLTMTDASDGETWSNFGRVTENYLRIGDYLIHPTAADPDQPLQIIELTR